MGKARLGGEIHKASRQARGCHSHGHLKETFKEVQVPATVLSATKGASLCLSHKVSQGMGVCRQALAGPLGRISQLNPKI